MAVVHTIPSRRFERFAALAQEHPQSEAKRFRPLFSTTTGTRFTITTASLGGREASSLKRLIKVSSCRGAVDGLEIFWPKGGGEYAGEQLCGVVDGMNLTGPLRDHGYFRIKFVEWSFTGQKSIGIPAVDNFAHGGDDSFVSGLLRHQAHHLS
jgi:hypothetical protein